MTIQLVLDALVDGNTERAKFYACGMISGLFRVGTDSARKILAYVAAGRCWDASGLDRIQAPVEDAAALRDFIVAKGREAKAAQ